MIPATRSSHPLSATLRRLLRLLCLAPLCVLPSCDNPACIYAPNGCLDGGGTGGLGSAPAAVPEDGFWVAVEAPEVLDLFPSVGTVGSGSPIVVTFSESMDPGSLNGSFEVVESSLETPVLLAQPPPVVGDGRMVILSPLVPLTPGAAYQVRFTDDPSAADVTGQLVSQGASPEIGTFVVAEENEELPTIIATWPLDLSENEGDLGEIVAVFDRAMDPATFDTNSFRVTVNGDPPPVNPNPTPLDISTGPFSAEINSVWTWTSEDSEGRRVSLGADAEVRVDFSSDDNTLADPQGNELPATVLEYTTAAFLAPVALVKAVLADPPDAIGRPNLVDVVPVVQVELGLSAQAGDEVELFLFGLGTGDEEPLRALSRTITVDTSTLLVEFMPEDLGLLTGGPDSEGVIREGDLHVAALLRRGVVTSALRVADTDADAFGSQPFYFDLTAPVLVGLGESGLLSSTVVSDLHDLVVVGRADERIRDVLVTTDTGLDNSAFPAAIMASEESIIEDDDDDDDDDGDEEDEEPEFFFVSSPVGVGVLDARDPPLGYTVRIFDRALNPASVDAVGSFRQYGTVGPGSPVPDGGVIEVFVYDPSLMIPVQGALVIAHEDADGVYSFLGNQVSDHDGRVVLTSGAAGTQTVVTADLQGYDLISFYGVPRDVLHLPLIPLLLQGASTSGRVTSPFPSGNISTHTNQIGDNRRAELSSALIPVDTCSPLSSQGIYSCPFGPAAVVPYRLGAQSLLSADFSLSQGNFNAGAFLRAAGFHMPIASMIEGQLFSDAEVELQGLLLDLDGEQQAIGVDGITLLTDSAADLGALSGDPQVTIEGVSAGLAASLPVGLGMTFDLGAGAFDLRAAYPGAVDGILDDAEDELGELVSGGTVQQDLLLRVEVTGEHGQVGLRPRFSKLDGLGNTLQVPNVPSLVSPAPGGSTGGATFPLVACDRLPDSLGMAGLHRFLLTDQNGRRWHIWCLDAPGGSDSDCTSDHQVSAWVPQIGPAGGVPLSDGPLTCRVSSYAWSSLDFAAGFLWSDIAREQEVFCHSAAIPLTQP